MSEEIDILKIIAQNSNISQRKIAEQEGISLGQVNFLIKKCVRKGFIKIEGQTTKSVKYNLTPKGFTEKVERTLEYIKVSYNAILRLTNKVKGLTSYYKDQGYDLYICGTNDEMMEICRLVFHEIGVDLKVVTDNVPVNGTQSKVIFYWEAVCANTEKQRQDCIWINIIE